VTAKHQRTPEAEAEPASTEGELGSQFSEIYAKHFDFVWRSVRMMGVGSDAADDVVQDVFIVAHRRLADFEARASLRTWLFAIARRVVSAQRRSVRRRFRLLARVSSADREIMSTPLDEVVRSESQQEFLVALAELPEEQRIVFSLTELEEMSAPEIASALGLNVNTVYSRLRIARRALAARLGMTQPEVAR
jgi:RNA polymerase sigma-70 factor (ECF subfamily)